MISTKVVKTKRDKSYTKLGKPLSTEEFSTMVKEADGSGYMTPEEFKKKCLELRNTK